MAEQRTLAIIKPIAVQNGHTGAILHTICANGYKLRALKMMKMNKTLAATFYQEHKDQDFYNDLIDFMTSGPIVTMVIEKENAIEDFRNLMGSTDPSKSKPGTLRYQYGTNMRANAIHGSKDVESAKREIDLIFTKKEIFSF